VPDRYLTVSLIYVNYWHDCPQGKLLIFIYSNVDFSVVAMQLPSSLPKISSLYTLTGQLLALI